MRLYFVTLAFLFCARSVAFAQVFQPVTCHNPYTQAQEIELGDKVVQQVYKTQPVLPDSDPLARFVRGLGERLAAVAPLTPGLDRQWPFRFHVVASDEINAFALPGGTMFVDLGAIQATETEAQLAGVMAHEMSHVILRHSTCNMAQKQRRGLLYALGAIGSSIFLGGAAGGLAAQGVGMAQNLDFMHMSRGDEKQADLLGVQILHDAGFDPRGLPQFFEIIIAKYGRGGAQFLSDHPNPGNRTEYVNQEIAQLGPLEHPIKSTPAYTEAHAAAERMHALSAAELQKGSWRSSSLYATAPGADSAAGRGVSSAPLPSSDSGSVPSPVATRTTAGSNGTAGTPAAPRLSDAQLGLNQSFTRYQGPRFSIGKPASWNVVPVPGGASSNASVALAPVEGSGSFGLSYGVVLGWKPEGVAVNDEGSLRAATERVVSELTSSNGLTPEGNASFTTVAGQAALTQYLRGASLVSGSSGVERDWLVTVARPDGDLDTLLFISPESQGSTLQPLFSRMLSTLTPQ